MKLVAHNRIGQPYKFIGDLSAAEDRILRLMWRGRGDMDEERWSRLLFEAGRLLLRIKSGASWIACDCQSEKPENPPVLYPKEISAGRFTLVRSADRRLHANTCPFSWKEGELSGRQGGAEGGRNVGTLTCPDFLLYKRLGAVAVDAGEKNHAPRSYGERMDSLARRLFWLISAAGLNRFSGAHPDVADQMAALMQAAQRIEIVNGVPLSEVCWHHNDWILKGWAAHKLMGLRRKKLWPENFPMQGYFISVAENIVGSNIQTHNQSIRVKGEIRRPVVAENEACGPYLVLCSVRLSDDGKRCELVRAYAHPRMNLSLFPVDSDYERKAAELLVWVAEKAAEKDRPFEVEKPLFDIAQGGKHGCRPDFLLRAGGKTLVVETMVSDDPGYRERKIATHLTMSEIGQMYLDERVDGDHKRANRLLAARVFGWLEHA